MATEQVVSEPTATISENEELKRVNKELQTKIEELTTQVI